jgi:hypothetical protein
MGGSWRRGDSPIMTAISIADFIVKHDIRFSADTAAENPHMEQNDWHDSASHWICRFKRGGSVFRYYFSQGSAHTDPPTTGDVLDCLASDAGSVEDCRSFEEWAESSGYDTDSLKALRTYKIIKTQAAKLKRFLGEAAYRELLNETERL